MTMLIRLTVKVTDDNADFKLSLKSKAPMQVLLSLKI